MPPGQSSFYPNIFEYIQMIFTEKGTPKTENFQFEVFSYPMKALWSFFSKERVD